MKRIVMAYLVLQGGPQPIQSVGLALGLTPEALAEVLLDLVDGGFVLQATADNGDRAIVLTPKGQEAVRRSEVEAGVPQDVPDVINAALAPSSDDKFLKHLRGLGFGRTDAVLLRYLAVETATRMALKTGNATILVRAARADGLAREIIDQF